MRRLLPILLTVAVLLFNATEGWSTDYWKGEKAYNRGEFVTAIREWEPLAKQGNARAQNNLGSMYGLGEGVLQNDKTAIKWSRLAAEQGHATAQSNLGASSNAWRI